MAVSNRDRVGRALDLLREGLTPYVEREYQAEFGPRWREDAAEALRGTAIGVGGNLDVQALLVLMWERWNDIFRAKLGHFERNLVSELRTVRNRWAHQEAFSLEDADRALDSTVRLLQAVGAAEQAEEVGRQRQELLRERFAEMARREVRRRVDTPIEGRPTGGLQPWRVVVQPHPDVQAGRYQQAEFAADLGQVHRGEGSDEYRDPHEFYRRTFLTEGLKDLLTTALRRLSGQGGDPVVELYTNFGGGKTHSMLALYHLFSGKPAAELPGLDPVLQAVGAPPPSTRRAVFVGTEVSPAQPRRMADGTVVRTLWGDLAWQLGGPAAYELVAEADRAGINPGSDPLRRIFAAAAPCLILIDEWVAFVRQLYRTEGLPAGGFETNLTFAQSLTEAARAVPGVLVVASLPASDIETGGEGGKEALARLRNTFGRLESAWRPASPEEGFEIVRRRLFQPITDRAGFVARDAVARAFAELYRAHAADFPLDCREADYERRIQNAYPIHPELFDRLFTDWSSLEKFQRTRGVLRLMAAVIHILWERGDNGLLILPAHVPIDNPAVESELRRYLDEGWDSVIAKDVDGPHSLPLQLDRENGNFGKYSACRRVARTVFIGSAPTASLANRGLEDRQIKLGCAQPGETVATFGDALRRLTDRATYLNVGNGRYWYSTQPTLTRLALDRAQQLAHPDRVHEVHQEIVRRLSPPGPRELRPDLVGRGDFARVHRCPAGEYDVPDDPEARLVILGPEFPHEPRAQRSAARAQVERILAQRSAAPRRFRNALVFLVPEQRRLEELEDAVRHYLAWKSIDEEHEALNLDAFGRNQARTKRQEADDTVQKRIPETWELLLYPYQEDPTDQASLEWEELRAQGGEPLADRASRKLRGSGLITTLGGVVLRGELDRIPLWRGDHVSVAQLWEDFARYPYLPRLRDADVLLGAIRDGVNGMFISPDTFAYAEGYDEATGRYRRLKPGPDAGSEIALTGLVVKPDVAALQLEVEAEEKPGRTTTVPVDGYDAASPEDRPLKPGVGIRDGVKSYLATHQGSAGGAASTTAAPTRRPTRFHGVVTLDPIKLSTSVGTIAQEIVQHLAALPGSAVRITLEIDVEAPSGIPDHVVRTVSENCRTLRFQSYDFEKS